MAIETIIEKLTATWPLKRPEINRTKALFPWNETMEWDRFEKMALAGKRMEGFCPICTKQTVFTDFNENLRESGRCGNCGSFNRQRQLAFVLRQYMGLPSFGGFDRLANLKVYNSEATGAFHESLQKSLKDYTCSEFWGPEHISGALINGIRHEDLQKLSFASDSLDLVLSSDVLEHMPDPYRAHSEIFRVLKAGGIHIFTVPYDSASIADDIRAVLENGEVKALKPCLYHGDPVRPAEGILVWTIFGLEMLVKMHTIGFDVEVLRVFEPKYGILGKGNLVFLAKKL